MIDLSVKPNIIQAKTELIRRYFKKARVLISVCAHRTIDIDTMVNLMSLFGTNKHSISFCPIRGDALISRARSRAASYFLLERKEDILFFLDDDIRFDSADFFKVIDHIIDGKDIVAGMYVQKSPTADKNCVLLKGDSMTFSRDSPIQEVQCANTGFMGISRSVFEKMSKEGEGLPYPAKIEFCDTLNYFNFFGTFVHRLESGLKTELSEDWSFCTKARMLGFKVWIDPSILLEHKGEYSYDLRDRERSVKKSWDDILPITLT